MFTTAYNILYQADQVILHFSLSFMSGLFLYNKNLSYTTFALTS